MQNHWAQSKRNRTIYRSCNGPSSQNLHKRLTETIHAIVIDGLSFTWIMKKIWHSLHVKKHPPCYLQALYLLFCNKIFTQVMLPINFTWVMLLRFGKFAYQIANAAEWVVVRTLQEKTFLPIITAAAAHCCIPILSAKQRKEEHTVLRLPTNKIAQNIVPQMHHHQWFLSLLDSLALHLHLSNDLCNIHTNCCKAYTDARLHTMWWHTTEIKH